MRKPPKSQDRTDAYSLAVELFAVQASLTLTVMRFSPAHRKLRLGSGNRNSHWQKQDERFDRAVKALDAAITQGSHVRPGYEDGLVGEMLDTITRIWKQIRCGLRLSECLDACSRSGRSACL